MGSQAEWRNTTEQPRPPPVGRLRTNIPYNPHYSSLLAKALDITVLNNQTKEFQKARLIGGEDLDTDLNE